MTADIGQHFIDIAHDECEKANVDVVEAYGWCHPHDNNTVFDACGLCKEDDHIFASDDAFRANAREWIERAKDSNYPPGPYDN